jgi:tetratricopeptide (TPR) repeat protein
MATELPPMNDMLRELLERRTAAHASGLAAVDRSEVEPFEAVPAQVLDPKQAWQEASAAIANVGTDTAAADWPEIVAAMPPVVALPFAAGHFPQAVRDLQRLARSIDSTHRSPDAVASLEVESVEAWAAEQDGLQALLAVGMLRLAGQLARAEKLLNKLEKKLLAGFQAFCTNERAANFWADGKRAEAAKLWSSLPDTAPVLFNRGLAAVFAGDKPSAQTHLTKAVGMIPESSGWHHLGRLYVALAQA